MQLHLAGVNFMEFFDDEKVIVTLRVKQQYLSLNSKTISPLLYCDESGVS